MRQGAGMATVASFALDGNTFEHHFSVNDELPSSLPATAPRHHRTSGMSDTPASSLSGSSSFGGGAASSVSGVLNPASNSVVLGSLNGGSSNSSSSGGSNLSSSSSGGGMSSSDAAGAKSHSLVSGASGMVTLELPDFACMLPSECTFCESTTDNHAAVPTPHTPVVPTVFEGEGLKAASARSSGHASSSQGHQGLIDEFDSLRLMEAMPHDSISHQASTYSQGMHYTDLYQVQQEGWEHPMFASLLARRSLSAVMEVENEGQDDEQQLEQQQPEANQLTFQRQAHGQLQQESEQQQRQQMEELQLADPVQQLQPTHAVIPTFHHQQQLHPCKQHGSEVHLVGCEDAGPAAAAATSVDDLEMELEDENGGMSTSRMSTSSSRSNESSSMLAAPLLSEGQQQCADILEQQQQPWSLVKIAAQADGGSSIPATSAAAAATIPGSLITLGSSDAGAVEIQIGNSRHTETSSIGASCLESPTNAAAMAAAAAAAAADGFKVSDAAADTVAAKVAAAVKKDEWTAANRERLCELQQQAATVAGVAAAPSSLFSYPQAEAALLAADMRSQRGAVLQSLPPQPGWLKRKLRQLLMCGACAAQQSVGCEGSAEHEQMVLLLCLAKTGFSNDNELHTGLLQAAYCAFTGKQQPVPRYGHHWGDVGFQGDDPATDLRGVGMLGLLQMLYLPHHNAAAAQQLYHLSISHSQEFPLATVSLNITRWTLTALRAGHLAQQARRLGSVVAAANAFYCGAFYAFYTRWCQGKTMRDSGFVLKQTEEYCRRHPSKLLQLAAAPEAAMAAADKLAWQP